MATALQMGLVPGFALQNGDFLANLITNTAAGGFGLGTTVTSAANLTGSGNNTLATARLLTTSATVVSTATASDNSVQLPVVGTADSIRIYNTTAVALHVFPPAGQQIDAAAANASVPLAAGARCDYLYIGNNSWVSNLLGGVSA